MFSKIMNLNMEFLRDWIGRTESHSDQITPAPIIALSATLDRDDPPPRAGDPLPPLWHWLYFLPVSQQSQLGPDGHPNRGNFIPPVPFPHRMFAGGRLEIHHPLRVGESVSRVSRIADVTYKEGRTGPLIFVLLRQQISNGAGLAVTEEQDVVFRDNPKPGGALPAPQKAPANAVWTRQIDPDPVLLFRYSALTFNGHRIHYDRRYAIEVEGYPGLVVHAPLLATLLLDLLRRNLPDAIVARCSFRAVKPLFDNNPFSISGRAESDGHTVALWATSAEGWLAMQATALLASPPIRSSA
jgi:3-methylfumaryl-CoA hydratase